MPSGTGTNFDLNLTSTNLTNISAYTLNSSTNYSYVFYNMLDNTSTLSTALGLQRLGSGSVNYTANSGFTYLSQTNGSNAYTSATYAVSFGQAGSVPEPSTYAMGAVASLVLGTLARRRTKKA